MPPRLTSVIFLVALGVACAVAAGFTARWLRHWRRGRRQRELDALRAFVLGSASGGAKPAPLRAKPGPPAKPDSFPRAAGGRPADAGDDGAGAGAV